MFEYNFYYNFVTIERDNPYIYSKIIKSVQLINQLLTNHFINYEILCQFIKDFVILLAAVVTKIWTAMWQFTYMTFTIFTNWPVWRRDTFYINYYNVDYHMIDSPYNTHFHKMWIDTWVCMKIEGNTYLWGFLFFFIFYYYSKNSQNALLRKAWKCNFF